MVLAPGSMVPSVFAATSIAAMIHASATTADIPYAASTPTGDVIADGKGNSAAHEAREEYRHDNGHHYGQYKDHDNRGRGNGHGHDKGDHGNGHGHADHEHGHDDHGHGHGRG